jgi:uncharacterized membrane protein YqjE
MGLVGLATPRPDRWVASAPRAPRRPNINLSLRHRASVNVMSESQAESGLREESLGELVKELAAQTSTLVRQEIDLAKAEMAQKGKETGVAAGLFGAAGMLAWLALVALTLCLIAGLATGMHVWLAALIVTAVYLASAGALAVKGRLRLRRVRTPIPEQTVETVKEDVQWAKNRRQSATK